MHHLQQCIHVIQHCDLAVNKRHNSFYTSTDSISVTHQSQHDYWTDEGITNCYSATNGNWHGCAKDICLRNMNERMILNIGSNSNTNSIYVSCNYESKYLQFCSWKLRAFLRRNTETGYWSLCLLPLRTQPCQIEEPDPTFTSPTTAALGATNTLGGIEGALSQRFIRVRCLETKNTE